METGNPREDEKESSDRVRKDIDRFNRLFNYDGKDSMVDINTFREMKEKEGEKLKVYFSGLAELDHYTEGFAEGELVVITGLFGNGKTLFAQTLADKFTEQNIPCGIFSFEVSTLKFTDPLGRQSNIPLYVAGENVPNNYTWLEERIIEAVVKYNVKVFFIDHMHFIVDMNDEKLNINIGVVMRRLSILAGFEHVVIFLICHQKGLFRDQEPSLQTCRDSSAIPQECHTGIVVHRQKDLNTGGEETDSFDQGLAFVKIDKARRSGTYRKKLTFQKKGNWLMPL
jgi:replicative DNA helicase